MKGPFNNWKGKETNKVDIEQLNWKVHAGLPNSDNCDLADCKVPGIILSNNTNIFISITFMYSYVVHCTLISISGS
jgi:hypothetical protein